MLWNPATPAPSVASTCGLMDATSKTGQGQVTSGQNPGTAIRLLRLLDGSFDANLRNNAVAARHRSAAGLVKILGTCFVKILSDPSGVMRVSAASAQGAESTLDGASLEEDEEMQELWAALLANALVEDPNDRRIPAALPEILRQISQDARLLNTLYEIRRKTILSVYFESSVRTPQ